MTANDNQHTVIYTIGHADRAFPAIEGFLEENGVRLLIDIRTNPHSKYAPDFNKANLQELCAVAGIGFRWMGDRLGGRPGTGDGRPDWDRMASTDVFGAAIDEVTELARRSTAALLCAEGMPDHCHRALLVAPHLERHGFRVMHILPDGSLHRHQPTLFPPGP